MLVSQSKVDFTRNSIQFQNLYCIISSMGTLKIENVSITMLRVSYEIDRDMESSLQILLT